MTASELVIPDAQRRFQQEYDAAGKAYHMTEREYFSTGGITFDVVEKITVTGQYDRYLIKATKGQQANLFSYKIGDLMAVANVMTTAGTSSRTPDASDTNILRAYETNDEDFAVRGIGFQIKGLRQEMDIS